MQFSKADAAIDAVYAHSTMHLCNKAAQLLANCSQNAISRLDAPLLRLMLLWMF